MHRRSLLLSVAAPLILAACGGSAPPPAAPAAAAAPTAAAPAGAPTKQAAPATASAELKAPGEAKVGDRTTCPTSGEEFTVTADSPKFEYKGKTYYFCCGGCDAKFAKDPEKYLQKKPGA